MDEEPHSDAANTPDTPFPAKPSMARPQEEGFLRPQRFARLLREGGRSRTLGIVHRSSPQQVHQERIISLTQQAMAAGFQAIAVDEEWFIHKKGRSTRNTAEEASPPDPGHQLEPASSGTEGDKESDAPSATALRSIPPQEATLQYLHDAAVEGVILLNLPPAEMKGWIDALRERALPTVCIGNGGLSTSSRESFFDVDYPAAFEAMTQHHLSLGSRHLAFLVGSYSLRRKAPRRLMRLHIDGFIRAIRKHGGQVYTEPKHGPYLDLPTRIPKRTAPPIIGELLYAEKTGAFSNHFELGRHVMTQWIEAGKIPDSLLCANDELALGALGSCIEHGIAVPRTLRLSGAGDSPFGRYCGIPLTTLRHPTAALAHASLQRLIALIEAKRNGRAALAAIEATQPVFLPCELAIRASTEPLAAAPPPEQTEDDLADIY